MMIIIMIIRYFYGTKFCFHLTHTNNNNDNNNDNNNYNDNNKVFLRR